IYSGKAFDKKVITDGIIFATIRPNNIPAIDKDASRSGEIATKNVDIKDLHTIIKDVIKKSSVGVDMYEASVAVAGGRGVRSAEVIRTIYELAEVLGGAVCASRGACDEEYCDYSLQIGQI